MHKLTGKSSLIMIVFGLFLALSPNNLTKTSYISNKNLESLILVDFFENTCSAEWFSGAPQFGENRLPCPGSETDQLGFVRPLGSNFTLENNQLAQKSIQTHPMWQENGYIFGVYDLSKFGVIIQDGDQFTSEIGLLSGAQNGNVLFSVWFDTMPGQTGGESKIAELEEMYDGNISRITANLSKYVGQSGSIILRLDANGSSGQDWAVWIEPQITRQVEPTPTNIPTSMPTAIETVAPIISETPIIAAETSQEEAAAAAINLSSLPQNPKLMDKVQIGIEVTDTEKVAIIRIYINGKTVKTCRHKNKCDYLTNPIAGELEIGAIAVNKRGGIVSTGLVPGADIIDDPGWLNDDDNDGILNAFDNCKSIENSDQSDLDQDGVGDICDKCTVESTCERFDEWSILPPEYCCNECLPPSESEPYGYSDGTPYLELWYDRISDSGCGCKDTDWGLDYFQQGSIYQENVISDIFPGGGSPAHPVPDRCRGKSNCEFINEDVCLNETQLQEFFCGESGCEDITVDCPDGCNEGACVCPDTDGGMDYYHGGSVAGVSDVCVNEEILREYTCDLIDGAIGAKPIEITCPTGCEGDACTCHETDYGMTPFIKGEILNDPMGREDKCIDNTTLLEYYCEEGEVENIWIECSSGCGLGKCRCIDSDNGVDIFTFGKTPFYESTFGTVRSTPREDKCLDEETIREYYVRSEEAGCVAYSIDIKCKRGCDSTYNRCIATCDDGIQNQSEEGVDCGGSCPGECMDCYTGGTLVRAGGGEESKFSFDEEIVFEKAEEALEEYTNCLMNDDCRNSLARYIFMEDYSSVINADLESSDAVMEAVGYYVDEHMDYLIDDKYSYETWHASQSAYRTLHDSWTRGCDNDYCGDCEDYAILRETLMRVKGVSDSCAYLADHYKTRYGKGHTFNIVLYRNKWRLMDYGTLGVKFYSRDSMRFPDNLWNDGIGEYWCPEVEEDWGRCTNIHPKTLTWNYVSGENCPGEWDDNETYLADTCP